MTLDSTAFAHWIKGYQNFYEPMVRAWFEENGYENPRPMSTTKADLLHAADMLESGETARGLSDWAREHHIAELRQKSRIQLDMIADKDGVVIGEFKSWGGYLGIPTWKKVEYEFVGEHPGLFMTLRMSGKSDEHELIEGRLSERYDIPVQLFSLEEMFETLGPEASSLRDRHFRALDEAVNQLKAMILGNQ